MSRWSKEKEELELSKKLKSDLDNAKNRLTSASNEARYEEAAKLQYDTIPNLEKQSKKKEQI